MMPAACHSSATTVERSIRVMTYLSPSGHRRQMNADLYVGNREPSLDELLTDPIMTRLLARDGITMADLFEVIADAKDRLARRDW
ncbi:MAG: hypothetical protein F8N37_20390 [Telmatospirillum sp.]|nr:hypothetical protein [Telmatospirillum sp.]